MTERAMPTGFMTGVLIASALMYSIAAGAETVSFERDVLPIINERCVMCHIPGAAQGDLALFPDARANIVNVPSVQSDLLQVEPGKPDASYFYLKLTDDYLAAGGSGEIMPPRQQGTLQQDEIGAIRTWIEEGAQEN